MASGSLATVEIIFLSKWKNLTLSNFIQNERNGILVRIKISLFSNARVGEACRNVLATTKMRRKL